MYSYSSFFAGFPHSSYSPTVSGSVGSLIVLRTSTNGTFATTAWKRSGRMFVTAPMRRPPALPLDDEAVFCRDLLREERLRGRDEVRERVFLLEHPPAVVPLLSHLAS